MKISYLLIIITTAATSCTQKSETFVEKENNTKQIIAYDGDLQNRNNGKFYLKGTTNLFTGIEILHYADGTIKQQLPLTNGVAQGTRMRWHSNGVMESIGSYSNAMRTGYWRTWNSDGSKNKEGTFVKGKPEGEQIFWHTNGLKSVVWNFSSGHPNGLMRSFYDNGRKKQEGVYTNNLKHGKWKNWNKSGQLNKIAEFQMGKLIKEEEYQN